MQFVPMVAYVKNICGNISLFLKSWIHPIWKLSHPFYQDICAQLYIIIRKLKSIWDLRSNSSFVLKRIVFHIKTCSTWWAGHQPCTWTSLTWTTRHQFTTTNIAVVTNAGFHREFQRREANLAWFGNFRSSAL